ncbi:hypothetical protein D9M71_751180 [compost metagenome]
MRFVQRDPRQPGAQPRAPLETVDRGERLEPGFLGDILGQRLAYQRNRHGDQKAVVRPDHLLTGGGLAPLHASHQLPFLVHAPLRFPLPPA